MNFLFGCIKEITYICINNRQIQATTLHIHYYIYAKAPAPTTFTTMTTKELTRLTLSTVTTLVLSLSSYAQEKSITLSFTPAQDAEGYNIYIKPLSVATSTDPVQMTQAGAAFTASVPASDVALYSITCIRNQSQTISTVSISGDAATLSLPVKFADNILVSDNTADNKALGAYAACATANDIRLWTDRNAGIDQLKALLQSYTAKADSVLSIYQCSPDISKYIQMWAYTSTYNAFTSLPNITGCKPDEMPFKAKDVMAKPDQILDSPMATLFPIAPALINNFLPRESSLMEQLDWLHSNFKCPDIIEQVGGAALDKFISRFDYAGNYEEGLAQLKEVTAKYKLDNRYVNKFISNRATIKGAPSQQDSPSPTPTATHIPSTSSRASTSTSTSGHHGADHAARKCPTSRHSKRNFRIPTSPSSPSLSTQSQSLGRRRWLTSTCTATSGTTHKASSARTSTSWAYPSSSSTTKKANSTCTMPHAQAIRRQRPCSKN